MQDYSLKIFSLSFMLLSAFSVPCLAFSVDITSTDVVAQESTKASTESMPELVTKVNVMNANVNSLIAPLSVNDNVSLLMTFIEEPNVNVEKTANLLQQIHKDKDKLNAAEKYLIIVAQAVLITNFPNAQDLNAASPSMAALIAKSHELSVNISDKQLSQPHFIQLHTILAKYYASQAQYDLAYLETQAYLKKYHLYRKDKRNLVIASIEKSFEVGDKKASNALLKSQNELKVRRVAQVKDEETAKMYNFFIIISSAMIFVLLFFRQLKIRNKLIKLTRTDSLTRVANRSALFEKGIQLVADFNESPTELSILLLDIDHFKRINDNFGHHVGDKVLVVISELIQEAMRSRDFFARLGGEEFVALLPYADTHKAKAIAMRINEKMQQYDFSSIMIQKRVTISIGIASLVSNKMTFDDLLHCADLAMYQAKEQGRNTVVCYDQISMIQERRNKNLAN